MRRLELAFALVGVLAVLLLIGIYVVAIGLPGDGCGFPQSC